MIQGSSEKNREMGGERVRKRMVEGKGRGDDHQRKSHRENVIDTEREK